MSKPINAVTNVQRRLYSDQYIQLLCAAVSGAISGDLASEQGAFVNHNDRMAFAEANASEALKLFINGIAEQEAR